MDNQDYISIGISFYNSAEYLSYAIKSIIKQTHDKWELILVDDGSNDNSLEIAKSFERIDARIRVLSDGQNKKLPYRLNQIIDESSYNYIARMDADDIMHPERLSRQIKFLKENPDYDLVSTGLISIDNNNIVYGYRGNKVSNDEIFNEVQLYYPINHATVLARKSWFVRNKYNLNYPRAQDYELWCRASSNSDLRVYIMPDLLYYYREEGLVTADKMIGSYEASLTAYNYYSGSFNIPIYVKINIKKNIIKILDKTSLLQYLARFRNKQAPNPLIIKEHQEIVNYIVYDSNINIP